MNARINFVIPGFDDWPEFYRNPRTASIREFAELVRKTDKNREGMYFWIGRTWLELARRNLPHRAAIRASGLLCKDSINILPIPMLRETLDKAGLEYFTVCTQGDKELPCAAHFWIAQNGLRKPCPWRGNVNYWREAGLIPRDAGRGGRIERIAFKGGIENLAPAFQSAAFRAQLAGMGIELSLDFDNNGSGDEAWNDYRRADLVLAVRNMSPSLLKSKPASKLTNAWAAGVPALLGPEPAYGELRKSPLDYIELRTPEEAVAAILRLRDDPKLYAAMVANGFERAGEFTDDAIAGQWASLLDGPVTRAWERWKGQSKLRRAVGHRVRVFAHRKSFRFWRRRWKRFKRSNNRLP